LFFFLSSASSFWFSHQPLAFLSKICSCCHRPLPVILPLLLLPPTPLPALDNNMNSRCVSFIFFKISVFFFQSQEELRAGGCISVSFFCLLFVCFLFVFALLHQDSCTLLTLVFLFCFFFFLPSYTERDLP
jgi:hypothetical protein